MSQPPGGTSSGAADTTPAPAKPTRWYSTKRARVIFMVVFLAATIAVVATSINPKQFAEAMEAMNPWWFLASFFAAMPSWLGAAIPIAVFSPVRVSLRGLTLTQVASSFVGVATPAGLGPIALSIRYLTKHGLTAAQAIAANVLTQLCQFVVSVLVVVGALIATGTDPHVTIPWHTVGWVALGVVALVVVILAVPRWRRWTSSELKAVWNRTYPEAVWALKHPKQLGIALAGSALQTLADVTSFLFAVLAFGTHVDWWKAAAVYLVFKTLGGLLPSPGGIGTVEASLAAGLALVGVPAAQGVTIAVGYRLATFYAPIVIGYIALRYLQRKQMI